MNAQLKYVDIPRAPPLNLGVATNEQSRLVGPSGGKLRVQQDPDFYVWAWPVQDDWVFIHCLKAFYSIENRIQEIKQRRVVVQAGGCFGFVPGRLAEYFEYVVTFELDPDNYQIMKANCNAFQNVSHCNKALGNNEKVGYEQVFLTNTDGSQTTLRNHGMTKIATGNEIESISLDSMGLSVCDAIILDAEGHEPIIIDGAMETIARCRPELIVCETINQRMIEQLAENGYERGPYYGGDASFSRVKT